MFKATTPPHLVTLIVLTAVSVLSLNMVLPSLASIASDLDADYATVSFAVSGYLAVTAVVLLVVGPLSDRVGRRPVLLGALTLFIAASLGCALAEDVATLLTFRMLQAAMISGHALSLAIVRDTTSEREAAGRIGDISMAMAVAPMLGPMLGGVLDTAFGWRANFHVYALAGLALMILCWIDLGETKAANTAGPDTRPETVLTLAREPRYWAYSLCSAFSVGAFYIFLTGAPLVARSMFGVSTAELGLYIGSITAGFMAGGFVSGRLAPRFGPVPMILTGRCIACGGLALGLLAVLAGWLSPLLYFGGTICVGLGNGLTIPSSNARAMSVRPGLAGSAAGLTGALTVGGGAVLTTITGFAVSGERAPAALLALMLAAAGAALLAVLWAMRMEGKVKSDT